MRAQRGSGNYFRNRTQGPTACLVQGKVELLLGKAPDANLCVST